MRFVAGYFAHGSKSEHFLSIFDFLRKKWTKVTQIVEKSQNFRIKPCSSPPKTPKNVVKFIYYLYSSAPPLKDLNSFILVKNSSPLFAIKIFQVLKEKILLLKS